MSYNEKDVEAECIHFEEIAKHLVDLKRRKAHDYGNSWRVFGLMGIVYQIGSKFIRIWNLTHSKQEPSNEALRDSFRDISVYSIMAQQMLDEGTIADAISDFGHNFKYNRPKVAREMDDERSEQLKEVEEHEANKRAGAGW